MERYIPDAFKYLLDEIHKLETELGLLPQKWKVLWDKLEIPVTTDSLKVQYHYWSIAFNLKKIFFRETLHLVHN